jgi:hypothetical protein
MFIAGLRKRRPPPRVRRGDRRRDDSRWYAGGQCPASNIVRRSSHRCASDDALPTTDRNHCCAAQLDALHELTKLTTIAIIAEALGYATKTIEQHASASACQENGGGWGSFVG